MNSLKSLFIPFHKNQVNWFYAITSLLCLLMAYIIIQGYIMALTLPIILLVGLLLIVRLDYVVFIVVAITPFSINLAKTSLGIGVSLPSEPLMFILFIVFWLKVLAEGGLDKRIINHPVTWFIILHLLWYTVTTLTSTMFIVSLKSTLARYCYISVFYFMLLTMFAKYENIKKFLWMYIIPLSIVIAYTIINQANAGFTEKNAHVAMTPFYNDHTAYAAVLAFFVPVLFAWVDDRKESRRIRAIAFGLLIFIITAIILSYTRAAWVALTAAFCCYLVFLLRIKSWVVYSGIALVIITYLFFRVDIQMYLERNDQTSSTDYAAHVQSIGNISTDDSNIERLNRWACALRMFEQKPVLGFGPGTYMFQYGQFQKYSERSGISTNFAEGGGSHSEYLGPLSEQGFMGPITFILIGAAVIIRTSKFLKRCKDRSVRGLAKGLLLGLITYWVHGSLNYFLDTEKAAVPFWGFIAALVAIEIYHDQKVVNNLNDRTTT